MEDDRVGIDIKHLMRQLYPGQHLCSLHALSTVAHLSRLNNFPSALSIRESHNTWNLS